MVMMTPMEKAAPHSAALYLCFYLLKWLSDFCETKPQRHIQYKPLGSHYQHVNYSNQTEGYVMSKITKASDWFVKKLQDVGNLKRFFYW